VIYHSDHADHLALRKYSIAVDNTVAEDTHSGTQPYDAHLANWEEQPDMEGTS